MSENSRTTNDGLVFLCDDPMAAQLPQRSKEASEAKRLAGRYTLSEAAQLISKMGGVHEGKMLERLMVAAWAGDLPVYSPWDDSSHIYGPGYASSAKPFYEEAFWSDLNIWLEMHEPRIKWRFTDPSDSEEEGKSGGKRPPLQQQHQEQEILRVILALGYEAKALPKRKPGEPWVKAKVRKKLSFTPGVFNKAWDRLRADGAIQECL